MPSILDPIDSPAEATLVPSVVSSGLTPGLAMPKHITSLATSGVLFEVRQRVVTFTKQDASLAAEISKRGNAQGKIGDFKHELFGDNKTMPSELRDLLNHRQVMYNWQNRDYFPYNKSQSYAFNDQMGKLYREYTDLHAQWEAKRQKWADVYEDSIDKMAFIRGDYFNRADYPPKAEMLARFTLDLIITEVPVGDFRVAISHDLANDIYKNLSRQHESCMNSIVGRMAERMLKVMESLSHCCELVHSTDAQGNHKVRRRKLYDDTVTTALQLCEEYSRFNLTHNPELEAARCALAQTLDGITVDTLRESDTLRQVVKESVDDILKTFKPSALSLAAALDE